MEISKSGTKDGYSQNAASNILHACLKHNQVSVEAVKTLIDLGADVSFCDEQENTVLHWAALHSRNQILKLLITEAEKRGVLENLVNKKNGVLASRFVMNGGQGEDTALHFAAVSHAPCAKIFGMLIHHGWDVHARNSNQMTPFLYCAVSGNVFLLQYLQEKYGVDIFAKDLQGHTALHLAAQFNWELVVQHLLRNGFDGTERDVKDNVPAHYAAQSNERCIAQFLRHAKPTFLEMRNVENWSVRKSISQFGAANVKSTLRRWDSFNGTKTNILSKAMFLMNRKLGNRMYGLHKDSSTSFAMTIIFAVIQAAALVTNISIVLPWLTVEYPTLVYVEYAWLALALYSTYAWWMFRYIDPGFIPQNHCSNVKQGGIDSVNSQLKDNSRYWELIENGQTNRLCSTCMIVKPLRSKHSGHANRCVKKFDHHCGYMSSPIAAANYKWFIIWAHIQIVAMSGYVGSMLYYLWAIKALWYNWLWLMVLLTGFFVIWGPFFVISHWNGNIFQNRTTNEAFNWKRYKHLKDKNGDYHNPFNLGRDKNFKIFCGQMEDPNVEVPPDYRTLPEMSGFAKDLLDIA